MRIDRILTDLLAWVTAIVWWREQKVKHRPYERLITWRLPGRGMLHKIQRPQDLCPRDVGAYLYEPFRNGGKRRPIYDFHLVCDHLEGMPLPGGMKRSQRLTHRITILRAEHWLGKDGRYNAEELFTVDDDLQGQAARRDMHIPCILHQLALSLDTDVSVDWLRELDNAKRYCMRTHYTHTLNVPKPSGYAIARPVDDGDRPVRIRFD